MKHFNLILYIIILVIFGAISLTMQIWSGLLFLGIFHLLMWLNVTITTLSNALVGRTVSNKDSFYRIFCIFVSSICFGIVII